MFISFALKYFATVFLIGFLLGAIRVIWVVPRLGEMMAVAIELPFMLSASWFVCRKMLKGLSGISEAQALVAGTLAFALLMLAEIILGVAGFGRALDELLLEFSTPSGALGLTGQVVFGIIPWIQIMWAKGGRSA